VSALDKSRVRAAFSRSAGAYDQRAELQREVAERAEHLALEAVAAPRRALDVGCGTGTLLGALAARLPGLAAAGVDLAPGMARLARARVPAAALAAADAEALPFRAGAFDLVLSTSTLQWIPDVGRALAEVRRVLAPGGTFCLAVFCGETLRELREAWREALPRDVPPATHRFPAPSEVRVALQRAGLAPVRFDVELRVRRHPSVRDLLESLRSIGAGNAVRGRRGGLGMRRAVLEMIRVYEERHGWEGHIPATWEIAYAVARRA
jgi:malonyl-CoA O-methyltransferase